MWRDLPFSQRNKATKRALGLEVGGDAGEGVTAEGWTKFEKRGVRQDKGGLHKIGGLGTLCQL